MFQRRSLIRSCFLAITVPVLLSSSALISQADACPMCKQLNETDDNKPRAYMYSIAFMLTMPALLFSGFGIAFYKMNRREQAALLEQQKNRNPHQNDADSGRKD